MENLEQLEEVLEMPNTMEKLQAIEEWIGQAHEEEDFGLEYQLRMKQNEVALDVARYDLLMDNFSWCLDVYEQNEAVLDIKPLLCHFKLFLAYIDFFPAISREEISEYMNYYCILLSDNDYSLRSFYQLHIMHAMNRGDREDIRFFKEKWLHAEQDDTCDCEYCEKSLQFRMHLALEEEEKAIGIGTSLLDGTFSCEEVPHTVYPHLLIPAWRKGMTEEAKEWQEQGYFSIRKKSKYLIELSHMLLYLSVTDMKKAYDLFVDHIDLADDQLDLHSRFYFYLASWCMLTKAERIGFYTEEEIEWFHQHVPALAEEFDERNGNTHYKETIRKWMSYVSFQIL